ncbi:MAG: hypothetical protein K8H87_00630 [Pseudorhodoplanes sp.]|nr:hypothetical protein [Pseudorhodoplanes sp.]
MLRLLFVRFEAVPAEAKRPGLSLLEHDPEKCEAVFGKDHAQAKSAIMIPKSAKRFSEKIMRRKRTEAG